MRYIYFGATWCGPCKAIKPLVKSSNKQVTIVNIDDYKDLASEYNIKSVPTIVGVNTSNEVVERYIGSNIHTFLSA